MFTFELVAVGQHRCQIAVLLEQFRRGLRPDAGDAWNVVGTVTDHTQVIDHLFRRDAFLCQQLLRSAQDVLTRIPGADAVVQQLVDVLVFRAQAHVHAGRRRLFREGREHIVGFVPFDLQDRHAAGAQDLLDVIQLRGEQIGHRIAVRLVVGEDLVAEAVADVEHAHQMGQQRILPQIPCEIGERIRHAGRSPTGTGERRHTEEELVGVVVAVDGHQRFSRHQTPEINGYGTQPGMQRWPAVAAQACQKNRIVGGRDAWSGRGRPQSKPLPDHHQRQHDGSCMGMVIGRASKAVNVEEPCRFGFFQGWVATDT